MDLKVDVLEDNSVQRYKIVGEIDAFTAPKLRERLALAEKTKEMQAELDLSQVHYMDSTGLGVFVGFYKAVKANGGHVKIVGVNTRLKRLFDITGLGEVMDIVMEESGDRDATV
ncbi:STAS domain-containing protein [Sporosarcina sp. JAI121]|uniref:STAS domain-containing protein n=1 Tax=Sporosarcina sp. JAI121 TaxID=2723064 RepID=UPI0015CC2FA8|nr:STAS domain-containing protein [Sporosarcina sp. JAI121]NYF25965.1 anti-sigma B factor antagonist [Sporosarcina sp. JAI121]